MAGSNKNWLQAHIRDPYVIKANREGWRSRAIYKLEEVQKKDRIIKPGMSIVDLGAAPGGWSQYAASVLKGKGEILAIDLLEMDPIDGVTFIQGDFREDDVLAKMQQCLDGKQVNLVLSDMAPNMSGHKAVDQPRSMYLAELALDFAKQHLNKKGIFFIKVFQGEGVDQFIRETRLIFKKVTIRKPKASRDKSRECYLLGQELK